MPHFMSTLKSLVSTNYHKYQKFQGTWTLPGVSFVEKVSGMLLDLKLNHKEAVNELIEILESAKKQASQLKAKGIIVFGDYNARNRLWGNQIDNQYGGESADKLDFREYSIISSEDPTFLSSNGNSNIDFLICSNNSEPMFSNLLTDPVVELFSGAPNRGHVPICTSMKINCSGTQNQPPKLRIDLDRMDWEGGLNS